MDTPVIYNDKDFLLWLSFAIFLGYLVFSRMRHKAPAKPLSDRVYLRFLARMFGDMMLGAFIALSVISVIMHPREVIFFELPYIWAFLVDGALAAFILFLIVTLMLLTSAKFRR